MGTIRIEEYIDVGIAGSEDAPVAKLKTLLKSTADATTSTSAENVVLQDGTRFVRIHAVEDHRVSMESAMANYAIVPAGQVAEFGVDGQDTLYYKADA